MVNTKKIERVLNYLDDQEFLIDDKNILREVEFIRGVKHWRAVAYFNWKKDLVISQHFFDRLTTMFSLSPQETDIIIHKWIKNLFDGKDFKMFYTSDVYF